MYLLLAGYGLAAVAFYAYIYLTARPDPYEERPASCPPEDRLVELISETEADVSPQQGELVSHRVLTNR